MLGERWLVNRSGDILADSVLVLVMAGILWGSGFAGQKAHELSGSTSGTVRCARIWRLLCGVGGDRGFVAARAAYVQAVALLYLVAGLVEAALWGTFHTRFLSIVVLAGGILVFVVNDHWARRRRG